jgi:hypothetical protein
VNGGRFSSTIATRRSTGAKTALQCAFAKTVRFEVASTTRAQGLQVRVVRSGQLIILATLKARNSSLAFNRTLCHTSPSPH